MAVLNLDWCSRAFSSCGEWGLLFVEVTRAHRFQELWHTAPQHVESSRTRDGTHVLYIGLQVLIHCTPWEVLCNTLKQTNKQKKKNGLLAQPLADNSSLLKSTVSFSLYLFLRLHLHM